MNRILLIRLLLAVVVGVWGWYFADYRTDTIKEHDVQENYKEIEIIEESE